MVRGKSALAGGWSKILVRSIRLDELQLQICAINILDEVLNSQLPCPGAWRVLLGTLVHR